MVAPEIVNVEVPDGVELRVLMVNVDDPEPVIVVGLNVPVAPAGKPLTPRVTVSENPPEPATLTLYVVLLPCSTVWLAGEAEKEKSGGPDDAVRISTILKSYLSLPGAVSLIVTVVPLSGVTLFCRCTQYVLPTLVRN